MAMGAAPMPMAVVIATNAVVMASHSSILDRNNDETKFLESPGEWSVVELNGKRRKMSEGKEGSSNENRKGREMEMREELFF